MHFLRPLAAAAIIFSTIGSAPISATTTSLRSAFVYRASLSGEAADPATPSAATGRARVSIDVRQKRVSLFLAIKGIRIGDLRADLLRSRMGPIHLHQYIKRGDGTEVVLVLPVPYGKAYRATRDGFTVRLESVDYAEGAKLLASTISFDDFVLAMNSGNVLLNIHTTRYPDGEISGRLAAAH